MRNLLAALRTYRQADVIKRTQYRLTLQYSALIMLFLCLFAAIAYSLMYFALRNDQKGKVLSLLNDQILFLKQHNGNIHSRDFADEKENVFSVGPDQSFYYWVDGQGNIVFGDENQPGIRDQALRFLRGGGEHDGEVRTVEFRTFDRFRGDPHSRIRLHRNTPFMVASQTLYVDGKVIGTLYVGKDLSSQYQLFHWLAIVLAGLSLLFFFVALYLSHHMSKRAMVPIARSLVRQREFVADASHELRTPLSVLLSSIESLQMEESAIKDSFSKGVLVNMKDEVRRMNRLVGDLLSLARSDSGTVQLKEEWFDFRQCAERTIRNLAPLLESMRIELELHAPEKLAVRGDDERLTQLLVILLDNAVKYSPEGGTVKINLSHESGRHLHALVMAVQDNGIGIKPEDQTKIFERFYREDKARTRQLGGHGLGLAIAKWIVDTSKGTIKVVSKPGEGSTFIVRIPFVPSG